MFARARARVASIARGRRFRRSSRVESTTVRLPVLARVVTFSVRRERDVPWWALCGRNRAVVVGWSTAVSVTVGSSAPISASREKCRSDTSRAALRFRYILFVLRGPCARGEETGSWRKRDRD